MDKFRLTYIAFLISLGTILPIYCAQNQSDIDLDESKQKYQRPATSRHSPLNPPIQFIPNVGQDPTTVQYTVSNSVCSINFESTSIVFRKPGMIEPIRMILIDGDDNIRISGWGNRTSKAHFYRGNDPQDWHTNIICPNGIVYPNIYPGIDLIYKSNDSSIKREYIVAPFADPNVIRFRYSGITGISISDDGRLNVAAEAVQYIESAPLVYQEIKGQKTLITACYHLDEDGIVSFQIGKYDVSQPLVIDPDLAFSVFFGGSENDTAFSMASNASGIWLTGVTASSTSFPISNAAQGTYGGDTNGVGDIFVTRINPTTREIVYSTFIGGDARDLGNGIVVDSDNKIAISGWTESTNFPTMNPVQSGNAGKSDGVMVRLDNSGVMLFSTYYGGSEDDQFSSIARADEFLNPGNPGTIAVTGFSNSTNFPFPNDNPSGADTTCGCASNTGTDVIVVQFSETDNSVNWATFLGTSQASEIGLGIDIDGQIKVYVTGWTQSTNFPDNNPFNDHKGGKDAFFAIFDGTTAQLRHSVLIGGSGDDEGLAVVAPYTIAGSTASTNFNVTNNAIQSEFGGGASDGFIAVFNEAESTRRLHASYFGGNGIDVVRAIKTDKQGFTTVLHLGGVTGSTNLATNGAFQNTYGGGASDGFIATLGISVDGLGRTATITNNFLSYIGGSGDDGITGITPFDPGSGTFNFGWAGASNSTDFPGSLLPLLSDPPDNDFIIVGGTKETAPLEITDLAISITSFVQQSPLPNQGLPIIDSVVTIRNQGDKVAKNVIIEMVREHLQPLEPITGVPEMASCNITVSEGTTRCELGDLEPGGEINLSFGNSVFLDGQGEPKAQLFVTATSDNNDSNPDNNNDFKTAGFSGLPATGNGSTRSEEKPVNVGDPIAATNGAYHFRLPLVDLGGPMPLTADLRYRSDLHHTGIATIQHRFWWSPYSSISPNVEQNGIAYTTIQLPNGNLVSFKKIENVWQLVDDNEDIGIVVLENNASPIPYQLIETTNWFYLIDPNAGNVYLYESFITSGIIKAIIDRNGNTHTYLYNNGISLPPTSVEDGLGRHLDFTYTAGNPGTFELFIKTITDFNNRQWTFTYEPEATDNVNQLTLRSITDPLNQVHTFHYAGANQPGNRMVRLEMPAGNSPFQQTYSPRNLNQSVDERVTGQTDAYSSARTLTYDNNKNEVTVTEPDTGVWKYESYGHHSVIKSIVDPNNDTIEYTKNNNDQLIGITDRESRSWTTTYHAQSGKIAAITDPEGRTTSWTYQANNQPIVNPFESEQITATFYDVSRIDYPDGTFVSFVYDSHGNILSLTDRGSHQETFTWNDRGQILTHTNVRSGVETFTYNNDGTLATYTDTDTGVSSYNYDVHKRLTEIVRPDSTNEIPMRITIAYDEIDRITAITDENGNTRTFAYDANGNVTSIGDPETNLSISGYDLMDRLTTITDRRNKTTHIGYDVMSRVDSITTPAGVSFNFVYDRLNRLTQMTNAGKSWQFGYNREGELTSIKSPLNRTITVEHNRTGDVTGITNALNQKTRYEYDAMRRQTKSIDPLGRTIANTYDNLGRLIGTALNDATNHRALTAAFTRDDNGKLTSLTDANGEIWNFSYTAMRRLQSITDPLSHTWTYAYDDRGRLTEVNFPTSEVLTNSYDAVGNLTREQYTDGPDLVYTYDNNDRLTSGNDLVLSRDAEERIISTTTLGGIAFGAEYDDDGRLSKASYNNNLFSVIYNYDAATGLLLRVHDDLVNGEVTMQYDDDRRLIGMTRSSGINTSFDYDAAGRIKRRQDGDFIDLQYHYDAAGQVTGIDMDVPLAPASHIGDNITDFTFDAASQITTTGYQYDERGRRTADPTRTYEWDGKSRLIKVGDTELSYNVLGDLIARKSGGVTTHFHHNNAIIRNPIVAEQDADTSVFSRYYVWSPQGTLLYGIDAGSTNSVFFYHFDKIGTTIALTNGDGSVSDAYAYDPFGRLLQHTGSSTQPFLFVGKSGVRSEGANGLLYQMGRRYYDATTQSFLIREPLWPRTDRVMDLNPYLYARNAPHIFIDPNGTQSEDDKYDDTADRFEKGQKIIEEFERKKDKAEKDSNEFRAFFSLIFLADEKDTKVFEKFGPGRDNLVAKILGRESLLESILKKNENQENNSRILKLQLQEAIARDQRNRAAKATEKQPGKVISDPNEQLPQKSSTGLKSPPPKFEEEDPIELGDKELIQ